MRLTQKVSHRISGRLSAGRRSWFAAPLVLLLGLLITGAMYAALSPATAQTKSGRRGPGGQGEGAVPRRLRLLPRQERRGHQHGQGRPVRPVPGRRRRRRGRLPGRHRPDADGPAGHPGPAQAPGLQRRGDRGARGVRRLPGPRARRALQGGLRRLRRGQRGDRPRRRVLPHQLHRLPQLRRQRRRAPPWPLRPSPQGRQREAHVRGDAHRAPADAGLLRRGDDPRGQARRSSPT